MTLDYYEIDLEKNKHNLNKLSGLQDIIDIHAHIFPEKIAARAVDSIGSFYQLDLSGDGTAASLVAANDKAGVTRSLVFSTATVKSQVEPINKFLSARQSEHSSLTAFGTLHPAQSAVEINETLASFELLGLKGIKLHPDFQQIEANSDFVLELAAQAGPRYPILIHAGDWRYDFSGPDRIADLAAKRPDCTIIAAHFGGWSQWQDALAVLSGLDNLYVDTSSSMAFVSPEQIVDLIRGFGSKHVLFGSDFPMWQPYEELIRLTSLPLTQAELENIVCYNACSLLKLS
ncbi:MAG: amidohydrolase family protein [Clostridiaceae bacterium]|nr:amidohydrolase family protein [Clostridiaceae bacterium]